MFTLSGNDLPSYLLTLLQTLGQNEKVSSAFRVEKLDIGPTLNPSWHRRSCDTCRHHSNFSPSVVSGTGSAGEESKKSRQYAPVFV